MKSLTIDQLLNWAFTEELPKGGGVDGLDNANSAWRMIFASSWGKMADFAELMTVIDRDPSGNFAFDQGEPHPDAVAIGRAVGDLRAERVEIPEGWNPLADWVAIDPAVERLAEEAIYRAIAKWRARRDRQVASGLVSLIVRSAVLGHGPDWTAAMPEVRAVERAGRPAWFVQRAVTDSFGKSVLMEVDGFNPKAKRPHRDAYQKLEFDRDPCADILARLDHQIWVGALRVLEDRLSCGLSAHRLEPWLMSMSPWTRRAALSAAVVDVRAADSC